MTEPRKPRRYTRKQKLAAVLAAEVGGVVQAEKATGISESTIRYWLDDPTFAEFRAKAREDMAEEVKVVAHLAWKRVAQALAAGSMEPRDALFAADKATTIYQLVTGQATTRAEVRDLATSFPDDEWEALTALLRQAAEEPVDAGG